MLCYIWPLSGRKSLGLHHWTNTTQIHNKYDNISDLFLVKRLHLMLTFLNTLHVWYTSTTQILYIRWKNTSQIHHKYDNISDLSLAERVASHGSFFLLQIQYKDDIQIQYKYFTKTPQIDHKYDNISDLPLGERVLGCISRLLFFKYNTTVI